MSKRIPCGLHVIVGVIVATVVACSPEEPSPSTPPTEATPELRIEARRDGFPVEPAKAVTGEVLQLVLWANGDEVCWEDLAWFTPTLATAQIDPDGCWAWYTAPAAVGDTRTDTVEVEHPEYGSATLQITVRTPNETAVYFVLDVSARMYGEFDLNDPRTKIGVATGLLESFHNDGVLRDQLTGLQTFGDLGVDGACEDAIRPRVGLRAQVANIEEVTSALTEIRESQPGIERAPLNRSILKAIEEIPGDIRKGGDFRIVIYTGGYNECPDDPRADFYIRALQTAVGDGADIDAIIVGTGLDPDDAEGIEGLLLLTSVLSDFIDVNCVNLRAPNEEDEAEDFVVEPCF